METTCHVLRLLLFYFYVSFLYLSFYFNSNFLRSPRRKREFQLAIAQVWNSEKNVIVVFKENLNPEELVLIPELKAYWETNLCIKATQNKAELVDRIRYVNSNKRQISVCTPCRKHCFLVPSVWETY